MSTEDFVVAFRCIAGLPADQQKPVATLLSKLLPVAQLLLDKETQLSVLESKLLQQDKEIEDLNAAKAYTRKHVAMVEREKDELKAELLKRDMELLVLKSQHSLVSGVYLLECYAKLLYPHNTILEPSLNQFVTKACLTGNKLTPNAIQAVNALTSNMQEENDNHANLIADLQRLHQRIHCAHSINAANLALQGFVCYGGATRLRLAISVALCVAQMELATSYADYAGLPIYICDASGVVTKRIQNGTVTLSVATTMEQKETE